MNKRFKTEQEYIEEIDELKSDLRQALQILDDGRGSFIYSADDNWFNMMDMFLDNQLDKKDER